MAASTYLANKLLELQVGKTAYTLPTVYLALSSSTPVAAGTGVTEPSSGGYARVALGTGTTTFSAAASGSITNSAAITFPTATADWASGSTMTYGVLYDASTAGNMLGFGTLTVAKNVLNGDTCSIAIGGIVITLT